MFVLFLLYPLKYLQIAVLLCLGVLTLTIDLSECKNSRWYVRMFVLFLLHPLKYLQIAILLCLGDLTLNFDLSECKKVADNMREMFVLFLLHAKIAVLLWYGVRP